jgi:alpha-beta hydrolase superfamily lysophospholipase
VDLILNVKTMKKAAGMIGPQVSMHEIEHAKHDVFLSKQPVREKAFEIMFRWLQHFQNDWKLSTTS